MNSVDDPVGASRQSQAPVRPRSNRGLAVSLCIVGYSFAAAMGYVGFIRGDGMTISSVFDLIGTIGWTLGFLWMGIILALPISIMTVGIADTIIRTIYRAVQPVMAGMPMTNVEALSWVLRGLTPPDVWEECGDEIVHHFRTEWKTRGANRWTWLGVELLVLSSAGVAYRLHRAFTRPGRMH